MCVPGAHSEEGHCSREELVKSECEIQMKAFLFLSPTENAGEEYQPSRNFQQGRGDDQTAMSCSSHTVLLRGVGDRLGLAFSLSLATWRQLNRSGFK